MHKATDEKAKPSLIDGSRREPNRANRAPSPNILSMGKCISFFHFNNRDYLLGIRCDLESRDVSFQLVSQFSKISRHARARWSNDLYERTPFWIASDEKQNFGQSIVSPTAVPAVLAIENRRAYLEFYNISPLEFHDWTNDA